MAHTDDEGSPEWVVAVRERVAANTGVSPESLPPLSDAIDIDGIDDLLSSMEDVQIRFLYHEHYVTVHGDGVVSITESEYTADSG